MPEEPASITTTSPPPPPVPIPPDNFIDLVKVIDHPGDDLFPEVSPDGTKIAYAARKIDNLDVFYFYPGAPRVNPIQVTRHIADDAHPSWLGNEALFFDSSRLDTLSIWRVQITGQRGTNQITVRDYNDFDPAVSPDGRKVVFCSIRQKKALDYRPKVEDEPPTLWVSNIDGSNITQIGAGYNPKWSPDGRRIIFYAPSATNFDIWIMNSDGTDLTQIVADKSDDIDPAFSPDMKAIVFASNRPGAVGTAIPKNFDIWAMSLVGEGLTQLTFSPGDDTGPVWSITGEIFFQSNRDGGWDIWKGRPVIEW
ncbi:MAG TPA: hypothetical protein VNM22_01065 [Candidatus Limnocylindrales bacterium]|nr:hypothetical protein [Candidatus Limnocylindrales bacterium]